MRCVRAVRGVGWVRGVRWESDVWGEVSECVQC